ncbi:hypothetical protein U4960_09430 [Altererythrobacter sp. H2]|uniref:hypothetical protein n=1 Tax=Altererythrobacter sp. H2 TaxID=3108391 RepID=UPI000BC39171|nr:hypothetical protein [Altererythrobacter sp. H2]OZA92029.1 MAG: hypothetical protein B7X57_09105 [Erythrobacter sp. 34-65-8]WRK94520.1 hypothetical protein U4960_09430 [Altererythrobacter sp. H2]
MNSPLKNDEQRDILRSRIEAAEERNAARDLNDRARKAAETAKEFVREHPLATVAGVALLGLAIGAMTKRGRRAGRVAGSSAGKWIGYATELGLAYAATALDQAGDAARAGQDKLGDLGDTLGDNARSLKRQAAHRAGDTRDAAHRLTRDLGKQASRSLRDIKARAKG